MQIYNTLTKKKEEFVPLNPGVVTMYVCGPTVYDFFHIGNARSFVMADIIRRYLEYIGYNVRYAMNLTDIDDKIINKANEEKIDSNEVAKKFTQAFYEDIKKLGIREANIHPKATEHMDEIVGLIDSLVQKGNAYNINGNVFYRVESFAGYGKLSGKKIDELESGSRVEVNTEKENPFDFSLWKKAKENEPSWDSPWGKGRPGWHTECSAMSMKHFGETIDIHAGGNDLIFPHHENEIAQSEAVTGKQFARYWMHFGFLNMKEEKMSKSLGNFFTAREILENYSAETIRLFFSQTHYSGPLAFSEDLLKTSQSALIKVENFVDLIKENSATSGGDSETTFDFESYYRLFSDAMDNDFNTPQATAVIFDFIKAANKAINETEQVGKNFYSKVLEFLNKTAQNVLGIIDLEKVKMQKSLENDLVKLLLDVRQKARAEKNFALSDEIRDKLTELGIELKDSKEGTTFKIK